MGSDQENENNDTFLFTQTKQPLTMDCLRKRFRRNHPSKMFYGQTATRPEKMLGCRLLLVLTWSRYHWVVYWDFLQQTMDFTWFYMILPLNEKTYGCFTDNFPINQDYIISSSHYMIPRCYDQLAGLKVKHACQRGD